MASTFPDPPKFYQRFADESFNPQPPPIPSTSEAANMNVFGRPPIPLDSAPPYPERAILPPPRSVAEGKRSLQQLSKELTFNYLELLDCLTSRPSEYARSLENVGDILRTCMGVTTELRHFQARSTLETYVKSELEARKTALEELREAEGATGK